MPLIALAVAPPRPQPGRHHRWRVRWRFPNAHRLPWSLLWPAATAHLVSAADWSAHLVTALAGCDSSPGDCSGRCGLSGRLPAGVLTMVAAESVAGCRGWTRWICRRLPLLICSSGDIHVRISARGGPDRRVQQLRRSVGSVRPGRWKSVAGYTPERVLAAAAVARGEKSGIGPIGEREIRQEAL